MCVSCTSLFLLFFVHATATTEIYTLSLHDALPISVELQRRVVDDGAAAQRSGRAAGTDAQDAGRDGGGARVAVGADRKSTRLNSSHANISYAVFCLKKKKRHNKLLHAI